MVVKPDYGFAPTANNRVTKSNLLQSDIIVEATTWASYIHPLFIKLQHRALSSNNHTHLTCADVPPHSLPRGHCMHGVAFAASLDSALHSIRQKTRRAGTWQTG